MIIKNAMQMYRVIINSVANVVRLNIVNIGKRKTKRSSKSIFFNRRRLNGISFSSVRRIRWSVKQLK